MTDAQHDHAPPAGIMEGRYLRDVGAPAGTCLALPGDVMTCPDGHPVLRVVAPVLTGDTTDPAWLRRLDCDTPPPPGPLGPCPTCGCEVCPPIYGADGRHTGRFALFVNGELARAREVSA